MTCLDTDFIIDLLRRKSDAERKLEELTSDGDRLTTTALNASELFKGAYNCSKPVQEAKDVRHLLDRNMRTFYFIFTNRQTLSAKLKWRDANDC